MSKFSEDINFPITIDNFPWLKNGSTGSDSDYSIFYAEHFNKIVNFGQKLQSYITVSMTGSGIGIRGLSQCYNITIPVGLILGAFAYDAYNSTNINQPGNLLPFEFVLTNSTDNYSTWKAGSSPTSPFISMVIQGTNSYIDSIIGGLSLLTSYPRIVTSLEPSQGVSNSRLRSNWVCNSYMLLGDSTLLIRGSILNLNITNMYSQSEDWLAGINGDENLVISIMGVI